MTDEQIAERLAALSHLKMHPRDDQANIVLIDRAERLYEERTGELRTTLAQWMQNFRATLETQDPLRIREAQKQFSGHFPALRRSRRFEPRMVDRAGDCAN